MDIEFLECLNNSVRFASENIDLSRCKYTPDRKDNPTPNNYYSFLAGFCAQLDISRILEIGTFNGGGIFSMCEGVRFRHPDENILLMTIDITDLNRSAYRHYPEIQKVVGDCFSPEVISKVHSYFPEGGDLLFIDAVHRYKHTRWCIEEFSKIFRPKYIILDDIFINEWMQELWRELNEFLPGKCFDITSLAHRGSVCGFGLIYNDFQRIEFPEPIRDGSSPYDAYRVSVTAEGT